MSPQREIAAVAAIRDTREPIYKKFDVDGRAGEPRRRRMFEGTWKHDSRVAGKVFPCIACGASDSRQPDHARGCPRLPPVTQEQLARIAAACEAGWSRAHQQRRETNAGTMYATQTATDGGRGTRRADL